MSKRKLLLADDSITIQKVVNLTFADEGIEVISVGDGDSAMRKFDEFMPDLVMADVNMPGLNGYEVCRIIKVTEETKHIPVILLVGSFEPFDEAEAKEAGADDFLTKPFQSIRQLVNKVTDLLNRSTQIAENETQAAAPVVDSFAETLEFKKDEELPVEAVEPETSNDFELGRSLSSGFDDRPTEVSSEFGDAGMDDEMIETSPANDYVSGTDSVYQGETTIDYAKTQPLNAEDLKGFDLVSGEQHQPAETYEIQEPVTERREVAEERSEPASFDEEARKLNQTEEYEAPQNVADYVAPQTSDEYPAPQTDEEPENISETEPQVDYYLPNEPEFEKEISDAETLAPEVSYEAEEPREADFSQATVEDEDEADAPTAESNEAAETPTSFDKDETGEFGKREDFDKTEDANESEPEAVEEETPETSAASFVEEPQTPARTVGFGSWEHPVSYSETEAEKTELIEEDQTEQKEPEAEKVEETEIEKTQTVDSQETEETPAAAASEDWQTEPETIDETPFYAAENAPALDFEDGDLLELPPLVEETGIRPQTKAEALVPEVVASAPLAEPESKITVTKTVAESEIALSFPPELIEAIAQAVAEKISAKTMSEVVPQITELVMRKLAEENQESKK